MERKNILLVYQIILIISTIIGVVLLLNRLGILTLSNTDLRILTDHLFSGFLIPIWFYILFLGIISFFSPKRKIEYKRRWFIYSNIPLLIVLIYWEFIIQGFKNFDQIFTEVLGITLSWVYFLTFRRFQK